MNHMRIARAGVIGLVGLALLVIIWISLDGLSLTSGFLGRLAFAFGLAWHIR